MDATTVMSSRRLLLRLVTALEVLVALAVPANAVVYYLTRLGHASNDCRGEPYAVDYVRLIEALCTAIVPVCTYDPRSDTFNSTVCTTFDDDEVPVPLSPSSRFVGRLVYLPGLPRRRGNALFRVLDGP